MNWWVPPLLALQFLTRIPVPGLNSLDPAAVKTGLAQSVIWFPAVGGLVGAVTAATLLLADQLWPRIIAVILALIVEARLTGAFHEDAVADFCDGFGGGATPQRIHEIMKDSRIGSYGTLGLGLAVALRAALLIGLRETLVLPALIASACFGRYLAVCLMALVPPVGQSGGIAKDIGVRTGPAQWLGASLMALPFILPLAMAAPVQLLIAAVAALIFLLWFRRLLLRHLGGATGDCLGFGVYAGQLIVLLGVVATLP
jgi:adenosylcobinamide-GDP ribazoletransferase